MTLDQLIIKLAWFLLESKYRYYKLCRPILEDWEFDILEDEYRGWCAIVGLPPTAVDMVGFDSKRPSCQCVIGKVTGDYKGKVPEWARDIITKHANNPNYYKQDRHEMLKDAVTIDEVDWL